MTHNRQRSVYVLNNYDLERVAGEIATASKPAHHLFGLDGLAAADWRVVVVSHGPAWLRPVARLLHAARFPIPLGDLGQQWATWRAARRGDLVYAPCQTQTPLLAYLRAMDWFPVPLVVVAHHPPSEGRLKWLRAPFMRWQIQGTDCFPALSRGVAAEINQMAGAERSPCLPWGPDLGCYARFPAAYPGTGVVAAGRTGRDWRTLHEAARIAEVPTRICCLESHVDATWRAGSPWVTLTAVRDETALPYATLLPMMAAARVLAVPLSGSGALAGLTSLTDAVGLGKPVIMTRHRLIDLDIEREGIGRWVEPGDVAGWAAALRWFETHPEEAAAMGRRARALAESRWNYERFSAAVVRLCERVVGGGA